MFIFRFVLSCFLIIWGSNHLSKGGCFGNLRAGKTFCHKQFTFLYKSVIIKSMGEIVFYKDMSSNGKPAGFVMLQIGLFNVITEVYDGKRKWPVRQFPGQGQGCLGLPIRLVECEVVMPNGKKVIPNFVEEALDEIKNF
ncbi:MAG: hypothetical protein Q7R95_08160 [bacterium]|nr:hypothetical protein [bacterium]